MWKKSLYTFNRPFYSNEEDERDRSNQQIDLSIDRATDSTDTFRQHLCLHASHTRECVVRSGVRKLAGHTVDVITGRTPPANDISVKHAVF